MIRHWLSLLVALAVFWLVLSGHYTPLLLTLGALSCILVTWFSVRMAAAGERDTGALRLLPALPSYWLWLSWEVVRANIDVIRAIVHPRLPISPTLVKVAASQRHPLGEVIYANSITLTPGTISVELDGGQIAVHALTADGATDIEEGGMARRVRRIDGGREG